jgi:hypothetical protein
MKEQINDLLLKMQSGESCIGETASNLLSLLDVSGLKFFSVEGGYDWYDASVDYFINLTDRRGEEVHNEYKESGGYGGNGKKWFRDWAIEKGYMRDPTDIELETHYYEL